MGVLLVPPEATELAPPVGLGLSEGNMGEDEAPPSSPLDESAPPLHTKADSENTKATG